MNEFYDMDVQDMWFQQHSTTCHKSNFEVSFGHSCDLTTPDFFLYSSYSVQNSMYYTVNKSQIIDDSEKKCDSTLMTFSNSYVMKYVIESMNMCHYIRDDHLSHVYIHIQIPCLLVNEAKTF